MDFKPLLKKAQDFLVKSQFQEALKIYQSILDRDPRHPIALQATGQIAYQVGNYEAAEDYFQKSLAENPGQYRIWIMLGETCLKNRKSEKAVQAFKNAIKIKPASSEAFSRLGNILSVNGQEKEAAEAFEKAFLMDENSSSAFRRLAMVKRDLSLGSEAVRKAKDQIKNPSLDPVSLAHIHYGLAYIYERDGDKKKFFDHLHKANSLQKGIVPDWKQTFEQNAASIKREFTRETLKKQVDPSNRVFTPIFIFGMPRSGTTLAEQIIASHPKVFGADEMDILTRYVVNQVAIWTQKPLLAGINDLDLGQLKELSLIYQTRIQRVAPGQQYITDKFLANYLAIGLIKMILPWAKLIKLERHPMDIALSIYKNYFIETLPFCFNMEDMAKFYCLYQDQIAFWENLAPGLTYTLKYETLVDDFEPEVRKLIEFCGLPWDEACLEPHKNQRAVLTLSQDQVRRPVYKSSIGKWKEFEEELEPFRKACLKYGYDVREYDGP